MTLKEIIEGRRKEFKKRFEEWLSPNVDLVEDFYSASLLAVLETLMEEVGEDEKLPREKCMNLESHMFGSCFGCVRLKAINEERQRIRTILTESRDNLRGK